MLCGANILAVLATAALFRRPTTTEGVTVRVTVTRAGAVLRYFPEPPPASFLPGTSRMSRLLRNILLCLGAALAVLSCTTRREAPPESVATPDTAAPAQAEERSELSSEPVIPPQPEPAILTLADYKVAVARRIAQSNPQLLYEGAPPPMLKSVVVLAVAVDAEGHPVRLRVMRGNGHRALEQLALQSVQQS